MATKQKTPSGIEYEPGSDNIFADLGLEDADELHMRGMLYCRILKVLEFLNLKTKKE